MISFLIALTLVCLLPVYIRLAAWLLWGWCGLLERSLDYWNDQMGRDRSNR